jgi:glycosyltransferase involved in cell wall biosynthesis
VLGSPLVSIIIPVYNGSRYLREAVDSALGQTYRNCEVIIVNDGSTDGGKTEEIALSYGSRIRYFAKENGGVATALNRGIREMRGEFISWLSHDDVYYPHKIQSQIDSMSHEQPPVVLYSDYDIIDADSTYIRTNRSGPVDPDQFRLALVTSWPINGCTALIPHACIRSAGMFNEQLMTTQDYDLWFRMARHCRFKHSNDILIRSRYHSQQGTLTMSQRCSDEANQLYIRFLYDLFGDGYAPDQLVAAISGLIRKGSLEAVSAAVDLGFRNIASSGIVSTIGIRSRLLLLRAQASVLTMKSAVQSRMRRLHL